MLLSFYFLLPKLVTFPFTLSAHSITHHSWAVCLLFFISIDITVNFRLGTEFAWKRTVLFGTRNMATSWLNFFPFPIMIYVWKCQCLKNACRNYYMTIRVGNLWILTVHLGEMLEVTISWPLTGVTKLCVEQRLWIFTYEGTEYGNSWVFFFHFYHKKDILNSESEYKYLILSYTLSLGLKKFSILLLLPVNFLSHVRQNNLQFCLEDLTITSVQPCLYAKKENIVMSSINCG